MDIPGIEKHFIENRQKLVKRMSFRCGNPFMAEDIVQTAYERAIMYIESFREGNIFDTWFSGILNNCLRDFQDNEKGYSYRDEDEEETTDDISCPHYPTKVMQEIYELIDTKSEAQKEILMMHFRQEYSPIDISRLTVYSHENVKKTITRFRNELKDLYGA